MKSVPAWTLICIGGSGAWAEQPLSPKPWAEVGAIRELTHAPGCSWGLPGKPSGSRAVFICACMSSSALRCREAKPEQACQGQSLFSLNIKHFRSLYLFLWTMRQTFPMYEFPWVKSTYVWFIPTARPRAWHQVSGQAAGLVQGLPESLHGTVGSEGGTGWLRSTSDRAGPSNSSLLRTR